MRLAILVLVGSSIGCSGAPADDAPATDAGAGDAAPAADAAEDVASEEAAADVGCTSGTRIDSLTACLATAGPDACAAGLNLCDADGDGLGDDLEAALARAYAPAFAFNGGAYGGNAETDWPANARHFVAHAKMVFRDGSDHVVDATPKLETIAAATYTASDGVRHADDPASGQGSDFWLCALDGSAGTRVTSSAIMLGLPDGVDLTSVVHPANGTLAASSHLFVSYSLLFAYNEHSTVDNHEGDWEGIAVFVDRKTGAVDAAWFERHSTTDGTQFVDTTKYPPRDPATEKPGGDMGSGFDAVHGLRFWDFVGARRHVVAYVATGSHAMYDYPANTRIVTLGPRDTHAGDGPKLVPWLGLLVGNYGATAGDAVTIHPQLPGEPKTIVLPWARFRGQWGCDDGAIAKSWPGPFGNARHPRPMFDKVWGSPPKP